MFIHAPRLNASGPTSPTETVAARHSAATIAKPAVEWMIADGLVPYNDAVAFMTARSASIANGAVPELIWLLEHPPLYTAGTSANVADLIEPDRFPVHATGRGGQYTYHGPGQRVIYAMLDVRRHAPHPTGNGGDVRAFVTKLESWMIATLAHFNVHGETRPDRVGVWVKRPDLGAGREDKIAAIGIRLSRWVSLHGMSLNVEPDLEHFGGIVPCGITAHGVTSLIDLGLPVTMHDVDVVLRAAFEEQLAPTYRATE
jgi:lipoyl(octanoyl) transferase